MRFPTPSGVGLIEAEPPPATSAFPASFPTPSGVGLIEARPAPPRCYLAQHFPRLRAWASLKQVGLSFRFNARERFPTPSGVGLIEARTRPDGIRFTLEFPTPSGVGLIEAGNIEEDLR